MRQYNLLIFLLFFQRYHELEIAKKDCKMRFDYGLHPLNNRSIKNFSRIQSPSNFNLIYRSSFKSNILAAATISLTWFKVLKFYILNDNIQPNFVYCHWCVCPAGHDS